MDCGWSRLGSRNSEEPYALVCLSQAASWSLVSTYSLDDELSLERRKGECLGRCESTLRIVGRVVRAELGESSARGRGCVSTGGSR